MQTSASFPKLRTPMKITLLAVVLNAWLLFKFESTAAAQAYSLSWSTIDGGGGTSSGGSYTISGTIGQPDAGRLTGGSYVLDGGFWGLIGVVQPPRLSVVRAGANVVISWPATTSIYTLESADQLAGPVWVAVGQSPILIGGHFSVTVPITKAKQFFRLIR